MVLTMPGFTWDGSFLVAGGDESKQSPPFPGHLR